MKLLSSFAANFWAYPCKRCGCRLISTVAPRVAMFKSRDLDPSSARLRSGPFSTVYPSFAILRRKSTLDINSLFVPVSVEPSLKSSGEPDVGEEITGKLNRDEVLKALNAFYRRAEIQKLSEEHGLATRLFHQAFVSFRKYCAKSSSLPPELHILFSDITSGAGHVDDLFPYFLRHAKQCFPHLECMDDLRKISDLRSPANWYPEARQLHRKVIFHAGPTNSGKTYEAMEHYLKAKSGVYCGPLKLLANEVFHKANGRGVPCDLITGEERRFADPEQNPAGHVACTVEMASTQLRYEVGIVDEIQMIRDSVRGWAWTRSVLGLCVDELHICGEGSAIELVREMLLDTGEDLEVKTYKRLTPLRILDQPLQSFDSIRNGDCVVAFSKNDIYAISRQIEQRSMSCAVIYGGLPPGTKLAQAKNFNDPEHETNVLVATDAIGMGLNLSIKRVIFYSLLKPTTNEKGEKDIEVLTTSQALQIAGRAGRFGTQYEEGEVTTFRGEDVTTLRDILSRAVDPIEAAGLHPTADQIELFAYHLPNATLSNLIDIFVGICQVDDSLYFMCNIEDFKFLADTIQHFARQLSRGEALTFEWVTSQLGWPFAVPETIAELQHLENVFDVFDLYLWLTYRFPDMFPDTLRMRAAQVHLDKIIHEGVLKITKLIQQQQQVAGTMDDNLAKDRQRESFIMKQVKAAVRTVPRAGSAREVPSRLATVRRPRGHGSSSKR